MIYKRLVLLPVFGLLLASCTQTGDQTPTETTSESKLPVVESPPSDSTDSAMAKNDGIEKDVIEHTLADIAEHNTPTDCWSAIEGKVYDVTGYIAGQKHPGGAAIIQGCGSDATKLFNDRPNGSGPHSVKARSFLPDLYIGDLAQ